MAYRRLGILQVMEWLMGGLTIMLGLTSRCEEVANWVVCAKVGRTDTWDLVVEDWMGLTLGYR